MSKQCTQEQFIEKAKSIYSDTYDYSQVVYTKSSEKVRILCPKHGVFEKTPNKHLQGQGCPKCSRSRVRLDSDEFIRRAVALHGDRYDYSKVRYTNSKEKVEIICFIHGSFWQTLNEHVVQGHNCPKCGQIEAGLKRCGDKNVAHREDVKMKKVMTCKSRFGAKTWSESDEGRRRLHEIIVDEGKLDVMKSTCRDRYGADFWTQSVDGHEKLHEIMSSAKMRDKIQIGYDKKYGKHYMQTDEGRLRAKRFIDEDRRVKMRESLIQKYGVPYVVFTEEERAELVCKRNVTKRKNDTFNTSIPEEKVYESLCDIFGNDNVERQYSSSDYPFLCDFYLGSKDLYIELNISWTHGGHWFDISSMNDISKIDIWSQKRSKYYSNAIFTWTERDVNKRNTAKEHNLNYLVFWNQDLSDFHEWMKAGFPNGKDWDKMYSWKDVV